jgi:hypothetical protein
MDAIRKQALALSPGFYSKLVQVSNEVNMKPEDLLLVMSFESGINPNARNPHGNASGLIQFMPSTLRGLGFEGTPEDFRRLSAEDQLEYVRRYVKAHTATNGHPFSSAAQYYVANFVPAALRLPGIQNEDPSTILAAANPDHAHLPGVSIGEEQAIYNENKVLDTDHDGAITYGDIQRTMGRMTKSDTYQTAVSQMEQSTGYVASNQPQANRPTHHTTVDDLLNELLNALSSNNSRYLKKKAIKQLLPNNYLLKIKTNSIVNAAEFARILCSAIDEELYSDATIHSDGKRIEIQTTIHGPKPSCTESILELTNAVADAFAKTANVEVAIQLNKTSTLNELNLTAALKHYDLFHEAK